MIDRALRGDTSIRSLRKKNWSNFFDILNKASEGRQILLELVSESIGDQIEEDWGLFEGVYLDFDSDTLYVCTPFVEHAIYGPTDLMIYDDGVVRALGVKDADGCLQIIHFREPLMLTSP